MRSTAQRQRGRGHQVLRGNGRHPINLAITTEQIHGDEERQHDVGRPRLDSQHLARVREAAWLRGKPAEQIELDDRRRQEIRGVQAVAISIERSGVGPRQRGQHGAEVYLALRAYRRRSNSSL